MPIRRITQEDKNQILALDKVIFATMDDGWTEKDFKAYFNSENCFIYHEEGKPQSIIGYIFANRLKDHTYVSNIGVRKEFEGQGIGKELMKVAMMQEFKNANLRPFSMRLQVRVDNDRAIGLYKGLGFTESSRDDAWIQMEAQKLPRKFVPYTSLSIFDVSRDTKPKPLQKAKELTFTHYKIDYSHPLGSGVFGTVYPLVQRPENEKGFFSYWFPYVYDWIYRPNPNDSKPTDYCVKVSKTSLRMVYENPTHPFRFRLPWHSFFEAAKEEKTHQVLEKNGMTNIRFFKSPSVYAQIKTRVKGRTLHQNIENGAFTGQEGFRQRKSFVTLLRLIKNPKFTFWDINESNIMYDEANQQWEIVDGIFNEIEDTKLEKRKDNLQFFLDNLLQSNASDETRHWLKALSEKARLDSDYTENDDESIRSLINRETSNQYAYNYKRAH
ncbi:GNAT family N-acetyltransferase [Legionella waltersii]|uniref:Ribosomal-protein-alanine N-acetyltransferase n=1 Tax=Legionella waltersii TaxID=66969 RepID=A0A0W1ACB6_9GAMM|nr:N-acetyltransferase [Legionella waltersii]KTD78816.1 ribosomal-protein-alanine N-acetyltransferase [Legionella waltersii]SNV10996.1 ribosomal-protein-alanine N-acetyltransferase [Legionella waltersii]